MELAELRSELTTFKKEILKAIREEIILKVKEEVKSEIIIQIVQKIEDGNHAIVSAVHESRVELSGKLDNVKDELAGKLDDLKLELATGNHQTHNLLSNIAEILNRKL